MHGIFKEQPGGWSGDYWGSGGDEGIAMVCWVTGTSILNLVNL